MNPVVMGLLIASLVGLFLWNARQRFSLMFVAQGDANNRLDRIGERLGRVWNLAIVQSRMRDYFWAGVAHQLIFFGFIVLLLRTLMLWGRGFSEDFNLFVLGPDGVFGVPLGAMYG